MSLNPFDLHYTLLAKHAQHVVLIHFPIALLITGAAFDFLSQWTKRRPLADAAYFNFLAAAISTIPTLATGLETNDQFQRNLFGSFGSGLVGFAGSGFPSSLTVAVSWTFTGPSPNHLS